MQGQPGLRGPSVGTAGGTVDIEVGANDGAVDVSLGGTRTGSYPVDPSGKATIPLPSVPPGTLVFVSVGRGARRRVILIEVVEAD